MLCLGEGHALLLRLTELIGEDNHEVLAREMLHQLIRQTIHRIFVGDGTPTGSDDYEHVVFADVLCKTGQSVPVGHRCVFAAYVRMNIVHVFADENQTLLPPMKLDATVEVTRHAAQTFQPAVETRFKLST